MGINIWRINDNKEWMKNEWRMNEEIIFKWDREWDRESIGNIFEKVGN